MLKKGADVNGTAEGGGTALIIASVYCRAEIAKILIDAGADVNLVEEVNGDSPLHLAAEQGCVSIMTMLLESGANPNLRNELQGYTPLMTATEAGQFDSVKLLLSKGSDPSIRSDSGETALSIALQSGQADIFDLIRKATSKK